MNRNKYILFTQNGNTEYDTIKEGRDAYIKCKEPLKFLYQPDKTYFLTTVSSTCDYVGHDHKYHKKTGKFYGMFIAKNENRVMKFLEEANWRYNGGTRARLYKGSYGGSFRSDSIEKFDWNDFESAVFQYYLHSFNIKDFYSLEDYGAIDVDKADKYKGQNRNPYSFR